MLFTTRFHNLARLLMHALLACCCAGAWAQQPVGVGSAVRVGVYENPPKIFMGADGLPDGIFGQMTRELARVGGWQIKSVPCEWQACLQAVQRGEIDLMPDVALTPERAPLFRFGIEPALHSWSQVYQRADLKVESILDLRGKRVAHLKGAVQQRFFAGMVDGFQVPVTWVPADTLAEAFQLVADKQADVVLTNHLFGAWRANDYKLLPTTIMFQPSQLYFVTGLSAPAALLAGIDTQLMTWKDDPGSFYFRNLNRWGGQAPEVVWPVYLRWVLGAVGLLLLLMLGGNYWLRQQVALKTRIIKASEERLNTILDGVDSAIYIKGPDLRYQYANRKACEALGTTAEAVVGTLDDRYMPADKAEQLNLNDLKVLREGVRLSTEEIHREVDGKPERVWLSVKLPLRDSAGQVYALCGISTDITQQRQHLDEIHRLAYFDVLTGLPNRRMFAERLHEAFALARRTGRNGALVFIDLDHFKVVNDSQGHAAGDVLLKGVAQRIGALVRSHDVLARLGGDEFVLLLSLDADPVYAAGQALAVAEKIRQALLQPFELTGGLEHVVSASQGIALFSDVTDSPQDLLRWSDMAMYDAKDAGRNAIRFFNPVMQIKASEHAALERDLRQALVAQQFVLHYQPQVDEAGHLCGVEALVRWQHPAQGLMTPGLFIDVAEETGLIVPLGRWVLQAACQQMVTWCRMAPNPLWKMAVNVSARQFHHADFVDHVTEAVQQSGIEPHRLELELTESLLLQDVDNVIRKMERLQQLGVVFSLDDFGTGYSSLSYLKRLPIYKLKVDQSFVRDMVEQAHSRSIVRTVVALANSLDLDVLAEGVETAEQQAMLAQLGCHTYQGYLFSRPMPADEWAARWLGV
ncbi:MAG TPA: EAL domain-containing protein [Burkholderiaceae bacterium]|nr:EAL domain-containing protein [Burkholderiaceae bacterium]